MAMIPLGQSDWRRSVAQSPYIRLRNRYMEKNPANQQEGVSILARPSLKRWISVGDGPNRGGPYSQPGSFNDSLFVMSGAELYKVDTDGSQTLIGNSFFDDDTTRASMAATAAIGSTPEYLFIADGTGLRYYTHDTFAFSELLAPTAPSNNEKIEIGGVHYQLTNGSVNSGSPAGTNANPWKVKLGATARESLQNFQKAIDLTGVAGTDYSTGTVINASATILGVTSTTMNAQARAAGTSGNSITTTTTITGASWTGATMAGGNTAGLYDVDVPDGLAVISVAFIAGYIIVVPAPRDGFKGRFYWIEPGETEILPTNFATAERSPDALVAVRTVGDQFALFGTNTTEMWYPTGDVLAPFARSQARVFERGIWEGSDVQIKDALIVMDTDGVVYRIDGGGPVRISDNSVEERTRRAIKTAVTQVGPDPGPGPGPLAVSLSAGGESVVDAVATVTFAPILANATGGVGPYQYRFYWSNQVNGTFSFVGSNTSPLVTPRVASVGGSTTATATLVCEITDAQGTKATTTGTAYSLSNTLPAGVVIPPPPPLTVAVSFTNETKTGVRLSAATFTSNTATPSGGTAPYTYAWFVNTFSGGAVVVTSPTSASTTVTVSGVLAGETAQVVLGCRVTDSLGAVGTTPFVTLTLFNQLEPGALDP